MIVSAEKLGVRRQRRDILKDVDVTLHPGEIVALVGANGAGKSTLLRCLNGLVRASGGSLLLDGRPIRQLSLKEVARLVSYMPPQQGGIAADCTVADCVLTGRLPHGAAPDAHRAVVFDAIAKVGLLAHSESLLSRLSSGERQRAFLARALVQQSRLLLLDEPTSALDLKHQIETLDLVSRLARDSGTTIVFAIHDLSLALRYAGRILLLSEGRLLADCVPSALTPELIARAYGVEARIGTIDGHPVVLPLRALS